MNNQIVRKKAAEEACGVTFRKTGSSEEAELIIVY